MARDDGENVTNGRVSTSPLPGEPRRDSWYERVFPSSGLVGGVVSAFKPHPEHRGSPVKVGPYKIFAGGTRYLRPTDFEKVDLVIPLEDRLILSPGQRIEVLWYPWRDSSPPPHGFGEFLRDTVIPLLEEGKRIMVYCIGSHGRTGTFLASLIALLEDSAETPDPIAAVRERHCKDAVETKGQAESIFELRGEKLPAAYKDEFRSFGRGLPFSGGGYGDGYEFFDPPHTSSGRSGYGSYGGYGGGYGGGYSGSFHDRRTSSSRPPLGEDDDPRFFKKKNHLIDTDIPARRKSHGGGQGHLFSSGVEEDDRSEEASPEPGDKKTK